MEAIRYAFLRRNGVSEIRLRLIQRFTPEILYRKDEPGLADHPTVGKGGIGLRQIQRRNFDRPKADGQHLRKISFQFKILGPFDDGRKRRSAA